MTTLQRRPRPVCPNIHVAVMSRTWARATARSPAATASGGKQGIFQYTPRGTCTASDLEAGATYISDIGGVRNYTGTLEDVFTCIAASASPAAASSTSSPPSCARSAPTGGSAPAENQGFLRPDASSRSSC